MKITRLFNLLFVLGFLLVIPFSCCDIFEDEIDPIINEEIGDTLWVHDISGDEYISYGPSLGYDDNIETVYYAKSGGQINWTPTSIVAVDAKNGQEKWVSPALDHIGAGKLVIGNDGTIYVVGFYTLYAINPSNGQFKWSWEIPKELTHSNGNPAFTYGQIGGVSLLSSGNLILASGGSGAFSRGVFNISSSGIMNWYNLDINGWGVASNIVIDANDNAYYYAKRNDQTLAIYSIVGATGAVRWTKEIASYGGADNNIMLTPNGALICSIILNAGEPFHMYQFSSLNGAMNWKSTEETNFSMKLMGTDGRIYQQNWGGVFTFSPADGQKSIFGSLNRSIGGAVINSKNQLSIIHETNWVANVHMYNSDGTIDWQLAYAGMSPNQMVITDNNKIIVFKARGVVAFQGNASEASSGWPTRYHDYRNTNNILK